MNAWPWQPVGANCRDYLHLQTLWALLAVLGLPAGHRSPDSQQASESLVDEGQREGTLHFPVLSSELRREQAQLELEVDRAYPKQPE